MQANVKNNMLNSKDKFKMDTSDGTRLVKQTETEEINQKQKKKKMEKFFHNENTN